MNELGKASRTRLAGANRPPMRWGPRNTWLWMTPGEQERALRLRQVLAVGAEPVHVCSRCGERCHP